MNSNLQFKRYCLTSLVISLVASALIGIFVFILGDFGDMELRILLTTISVGAYSLAGLCCSVLFEHNKCKPFALAGIALSLAGFLCTFSIIWELFGRVEDYMWKVLILLMILSFSMAHASLLLLLKRVHQNLEYARDASLSFIGIVALMLITLTITEGDIASDVFYRILGVFAILDVLGTIVTPILFKMAVLKEATPQQAPQQPAASPTPAPEQPPQASAEQTNPSVPEDGQPPTINTPSENPPPPTSV